MKLYHRLVPRLTAIILTLILSAGICYGISANSFSDVTKFNEAIDLLSDIEVIKGYSSSRFGPDDDVTRWQMALLISKLKTGRVETSVWENANTSTAFTDVEASRHYPAAIAYAHNNGIIIGQSAEIFNPDANITVQDGITMCVRALGYPRSSYDSGYPNSYISKGKELGLFEGLYNLSYTATLSRGQTAQMLYNALFSPTYGGSTLASDAFDFIDANIVLVATENLRFDTSVSFAKRGTLNFCEINEYGKLGDSFTLDANLFDFDEPNDYIGVMYSVKATGNFDTILSLELVSKTLTSSKTTALTVNSASATITMGGTTYSPKSIRSYQLEVGKTPSSKEILIYSLSDDVAGNAYDTGTLLTAKKLEGTTGYYDMIAYDDNGDGYADRAFYKSYAFGQYKLDTAGKLAIADNNTKNSVTLTGKTPADGDYVIYSYNSQTQTLDILKILTKVEGTIGSYTAATNTLILDNVSYLVGSENVPGASPAKVAQTLITSTSYQGRKLSGYVDAERKIMYVYELKGEEVSLSGNYYDTNTYMVTSISYMTTGTIGTTAIEYNPVVYLNNNNGSPYIVSSVNGTAASTANIVSLLKIGDVVQITKSSSKTYTNSTGASSIISVLDFTVVNGKATYTTSSTANTFLHVQNNLFYIVENNTVKLTPAITSTTSVYIYNGSGVNVYDYTALTTSDSWKYISGYSSKVGFPLTNQYYSFYVSTLSSLTTNGVAYAIYMRPFDFSNYAANSTAYNNIVYISASAVNAPGGTTNGTTYSYTYVGFDMNSAVNTTVSLLSTKGRLTTAGYYKVLNNYITDITPVTTSASNTSVTLLLSPTVTGVSSYGTTDSLLFTISNGTTTSNYIVKKSNIKIYSVNSGSLLTGSSMAVVSDTDYNAYLINLIAGTPSFIKGIFFETPVVNFGIHEGIFCLII